MQGIVTVIKTNGQIEKHPMSKPPRFEDIQKFVGGNIEMVGSFVEYEGKPCVVFCNEEGKLEDLPFNMAATSAWMTCRFDISDVLVGDVAICQGDEAWMSLL